MLTRLARRDATPAVFVVECRTGKEKEHQKDRGAFLDTRHVMVVAAFSHRISTSRCTFDSWNERVRIDADHRAISSNFWRIQRRHRTQPCHRGLLLLRNWKSTSGVKKEEGGGQGRCSYTRQGKETVMMNG